MDENLFKTRMEPIIRRVIRESMMRPLLFSPSISTQGLNERTMLMRTLYPKYCRVQKRHLMDNQTVYYLMCEFGEDLDQIDDDTPVKITAFAGGVNVGLWYRKYGEVHTLYSDVHPQDITKLFEVRTLKNV